MPTPRRPKLTIEPPDDTTAMIDMAAAFSHGARKGKRMGWSVKAVQLGQAWMKDRLSKKKKDYWAVRAKAVDVAYVVGRLAATLADSQRSSVIQESHLQAALDQIGRPGPRIMKDDCPF